MKYNSTRICQLSFRKLSFLFSGLRINNIDKVSAAVYAAVDSGGWILVQLDCLFDIRLNIKGSEYLIKVTMGHFALTVYYGMNAHRIT